MADIEYPVIAPIDIERGAACIECRRPFSPGDRYATRLIGVVVDTPLTEVLCLSCDQASLV
jgi:RNase P subunit RPR2